MGRLYIPEDGIGDIRTLLSLSDAQINQLSSLLDSDLITESSNALLDRLSDALQCRASVCATAWSVARYVGSQKKTQKIADDDLIAQLVDEVKTSAPDLAEQISSRRSLLLALFAPKPEADRHRKIHRLTWGPEKAAKVFRTVCDLRPVFDGERKVILTSIPVTLLVVDYTDEGGDEQTIVLQLNNESLERLRECLDTLDGKLATLGEYRGERTEAAPQEEI